MKCQIKNDFPYKWWNNIYYLTFDHAFFSIIIKFAPFQIKFPLVLQAPTQGLQISIQVINISQVINSAIPNNSGGYNKNAQHLVGPLVMRDTSIDIGDKNIGSSNYILKRKITFHIFPMTMIKIDILLN